MALPQVPGWEIAPNARADGDHNAVDKHDNCRTRTKSGPTRGTFLIVVKGLADQSRVVLKNLADITLLSARS